MAIDVLGEESAKAGWTPDGGRTYEIAFRVDTDNPHIGPKAVMDHFNLFSDTTYRFPMTTSATESDPRCRLVDVGVSQELDGKRHVVTLKFGTVNYNEQQQGPIGSDGARDPFAAAPLVRCRNEAEEFYPWLDRDGNSIQNEAADPFDPPPAIAVPLVVFEVSRNERFFPWELIETMQGRLNESEWMGFPAESILCRSIVSERQWNDDIQGMMWPTVYEFAFKGPVVVGSGGSPPKIRPGWRLQILNCGKRQLTNAVTMQKDPIVIGGVAVSEPYPLDEHGMPLSEGGEPIYLEFDVYPKGDFSVFGFPPDLFSAGTPETP